MSASCPYELRSRKRKSPDTDNSSTEDETNSPQQPRKKRKLCDSPTYSNNKDNDNNNIDDDMKCDGITKPISDTMQFDIRSWCWRDSNPYKSFIKLTNNKTLTKGLKMYDWQKRRGHRIVVIDGISGDVEQSITFDSWADIYSGIRLRIFMQTLQFKPNKWVIVIIHDSGYNINTEAAWHELEEWGVKHGQHPQHREAYILILSTNRNKNWWEHIVNPQNYFESKYDVTINSWNKKKLKKLKKKTNKKRNKKNNKKKEDDDDDVSLHSNSSISNFITDSQFKLLDKYGSNVFFQQKTKEEKGPLMLKGFLPKMKPIIVEDDQKYWRPTPIELAIKNGVKPCDTETSEFYCVSCLNNNDLDHMLICMDNVHEMDENARNVMSKEKKLREQIKGSWDEEEIERKFRVKPKGQCFHIYCVTYPDEIWLRWCQFMGVEFDPKPVTPRFVELNIEKQQKTWKEKKFGHNDQSKVCNIHRKDIKNEPDSKEMESYRILAIKKENNKKYYERKKKKVKKKDNMDTDTGDRDFYEEYGDEYRLTPKIRDLSQWFCHYHRRGHRIFCCCGKPMVEQLCGNANGETSDDKKKGFKGLYCNNYDKGCTKLIEPNQTVFRCMTGARCQVSDDGYDYCMKCMTQNISKYDPKITCLCGKRLILGKVLNVKAIFADKMDKKTTTTTTNNKIDAVSINGLQITTTETSKSEPNILYPSKIPYIDPNRSNMSSVSLETDTTSSTTSSSSEENKYESPVSTKRCIKKASTYRCAWCLKKIVDKNESLYYCPQQKSECIRIIKTHFTQFQPFVVCVACVVQSNWMTQTCICGCNLHCRLLADWIHHDAEAYDHNILDTSPPLPNSFEINDDKKDENNNDKQEMEIDDNDNDYVQQCLSESAIDFYVKRRTNNDEELYYHEISRKYVECSQCLFKISAYKFVFICNNHLKHGDSTYYLCGKCAIKQREKQSLFPECHENVEVVLLFVAHDGISQSSLWQKWLNEDDKIRKKFGIAVQCNNYSQLVHGSSFAEKYRIDVQRPTSWGKLTVPLTIQKSIQISLTKYPKCKRFYIISGREIPLVSMKHLYSMPNVTQIMVKKITKVTARKLKKTRMGKLVQWYSHHAAMCLHRDDAEMISVAPWKEYFADSDQWFAFVGCPDEFLFGTTLNAMGINMRKEIWREMTTDFELPTKINVRHPINWTNLNKLEEFLVVTDNNDVRGRNRKSLKQLLMDEYKKPDRLWGYGPCFFRKIASSVKFNQFIPWKLCKIDPPIIDIKNGIDETITYRQELDKPAFMDQDEIFDNELIQKNNK